MPDTPFSAELQGAYLGFRSVKADGLVLLAEQSPQTALRAAGVRIAGAPALAVIADEAAAKSSVRAGWCDFLVYTLDEAVRTLKLALRRGAAMGVALHAQPAMVLAECVSRGVQPCLVDVDAPALLERGAERIAWQHELHPDEQWMGWRAEPRHAAALQRVDAAAAACVRTRREEKLRWLQHAPRALGRAGAWQRILPMTEVERAALRAVIAAEAVAEVTVSE